LGQFIVATLLEAWLVHSSESTYGDYHDCDAVECYDGRNILIASVNIAFQQLMALLLKSLLLFQERSVSTQRHAIDNGIKAC
jgi:hypothetical protein